MIHEVLVTLSIMYRSLILASNSICEQVMIGELHMSSNVCLDLLENDDELEIRVNDIDSSSNNLAKSRSSTKRLLLRTVQAQKLR